MAISCSRRSTFPGRQRWTARSWSGRWILLIPRSNDRRYLLLVKEKVELLEGRLASVAVDMRRPTQLLVLKRRNPLCLHYEASLMAP